MLKQILDIINRNLYKFKTLIMPL